MKYSILLLFGIVFCGCFFSCKKKDQVDITPGTPFDSVGYHTLQIAKSRHYTGKESIQGYMIDTTFLLDETMSMGYVNDSTIAVKGDTLALSGTRYPYVYEKSLTGSHTWMYVYYYYRTDSISYSYHSSQGLMYQGTDIELHTD